MKYIILFTLFILSISTLCAIDNTEIKERYTKSYNYEKMEQYAEAIKVLVPIYEEYQNTYMINIRLGWLCYLDNKAHNAINYYKQSSLINPLAIAPKLGLIRIYLNRYEFNEAELLSYNILKKDYYNYYGNYYAIQALIGEKKYDIAIELTKKMLVLYPIDTLFLEQLFIAYKATKNTYLKSLKEDILIIDPNNILANSHLQTQTSKPLL